MPQPTDATLLAHLAGALEPGPEAEVRAELSRSTALQHRLARLRRRTEPPPQRFRIPPPGIFGGRRPVPIRAMPAAVMSAEAEDADSPHHRIAARPGERWRLHITAQPTPERLTPIVLERLEDGAWEVTFPEDEDDLLTLADLPTSTAGAHLLDLGAPTTPGDHRMALALIPAHLPIDWSHPTQRWTTLQAGIEDGTFPVAAVQVHVTA